MVPSLETERLHLRPFELADAPQIQAIFPQWEIVQYLASAVPWPYPPDGAYTFLRDHALPAMAQGDSWIWSLRLKTAPEQIIGAIEVCRGAGNNRGFWIVPQWRRQGLMTEAVIAATDYWFDVLGFPLLRAPKAIANAGSRRISEKTGMRIVEVVERDFVGGRFLSEIWEITAEEWHAYRKRQ